MATSAVSYHHTIHAQPPKTWQQTLSEIDWKTHAVVVLSYSLVAIGLAFAVASFYLAFVVHPMIAVASPILPIAGGILLPNQFSKTKTTTPSPEPITKPDGISNISMNCWCNSALQMLFHVKAYREKLDKIPFLKQVHNDYLEGKPIDSQKVREWFFKQGYIESQNCDDPSDISEVMEWLIPKLFSENKTEAIFEKLNLGPKGEVLKIEKEAQSTFPFIRLIDYHFPDDRNFLKAMQNFFHQSETLETKTIDDVRHSNVTIKTTGFFLEPPKELNVSVSPVDLNTPPKSHNGALKWTLQAHIAGKRATYEADGMVVANELGRVIHYTSLFKKEGKWYHANDKTVDLISQEDLEELSKKAVFFHFVTS